MSRGKHVGIVGMGSLVHRAMLEGTKANHVVVDEVCTEATTMAIQEKQAQDFMDRIHNSGKSEMQKFLAILRYVQITTGKGLTRREMRQLGIEIDRVAIKALLNKGYIQADGEDYATRYEPTQLGISKI